MKSCQQHDMIFRSPFKRCVLCTGTGNDLITPNNLRSSIVRVACVDGCRSAKLIRKTCQSCGAVYDLHTAVMRSEGSTEWLNMPLDQVGFMRVTARLYMQVALLQQFKVKLRTYLASYESMSREYNHCWAVQGQSICLRIDDVAGGPNLRPVDFSSYLTNRCALSGNGQDLMRAMELFEIQNVAIAEYDQAVMARKHDGSAAGSWPSGFRWGLGEEWPLHSLSNVLCDGDSLRQPFLAPGGGHISLFSLHATPSSYTPRGTPQGGSSRDDNNIQQLQLTSTDDDDDDDDDDDAKDDELQAALEEDQRSSLRPNRNRDGMRDIASTFVKAIGKTCGHLSHLHQLHRCSHLCCQKLSRFSCPESACNDGLVSSQLTAGVWILDGGVNVHIHCCEVEGCTEPPITRKSFTCLKHSGSSTRGPPDSSADCSRKGTYRGLLMLYSACGLPLAYQLQYTPECPASVLQFLDQVSKECFAGLLPSVVIYNDALSMLEHLVVVSPSFSPHFRPASSPDQDSNNPRSPVSGRSVSDWNKVLWLADSMRWRVSYLAACDAGLKPYKTLNVKFQHSSTCCSTPQQQQLETTFNERRIHHPSSQHPVETLIMKTPLASFQLEVTPSEGFLPSQQDEVTEDTKGLFSSYQQQRGTNRPRNISGQRPLSVDASSNYSKSEVLEGSTRVFNGPCGDYASHHVSNKMLLLSRCSPFSSDHLKDFSVFDPKWVHGMQWLDRAHRICTLEMVLDALPLKLNDMLRHSGCSASSLRNWSWQNICTPNALKISNVLLQKLGMVPATSHESTTQPYGFVYMQVQRKYEDMQGSEMDVEAVRAAPVQIFRLAVNTELAESKWRDLNALANLKGMTQINALLHLRIYLSSCAEWMMTERRMEDMLDSSWKAGGGSRHTSNDDEVASHDHEITRLIHEEENDLVMREEVIVQPSQQRESQANRRRVLRAGFVFRNRRCRPMLPRLITGPLIMEGEAEIFPLQGQQQSLIERLNSTLCTRLASVDCPQPEEADTIASLHGSICSLLLPPSLIHASTLQGKACGLAEISSSSNACEDADRSSSGHLTTACHAEAAAQSNLQMIQPGLGFERDVETSQHKGSFKRMSRDRGLLEHVTLEHAVSLPKEDGASNASFIRQPPPELDEHLIRPREPTAVSWRESGVKRFRLTSLHVAVAGNKEISGSSTKQEAVANQLSVAGSPKGTTQQLSVTAASITSLGSDHAPDVSMTSMCRSSVNETGKAGISTVQPGQEVQSRPHSFRIISTVHDAFMQSSNDDVEIRNSESQCQAIAMLHYGL